ncbi:MAG: hypothetical protein SPJ16_01550 [Helicobacter sp.]|nr:hypothetical protein [Helicobacter sp.]MDY5949876.1 hypothetical protein [Helicobacter sp.]
MQFPHSSLRFIKSYLAQDKTQILRFCIMALQVLALKIAGSYLYR